MSESSINRRHTMSVSETTKPLNEKGGCGSEKDNSDVNYINIDELLSDLARLKIKLSIESNKLQINASEGAVSESVLYHIKKHKYALIEKLKSHKERQVNFALPELFSDESNRHKPFPLSEVQAAYWVGRSGVFDFGSVSTHLYYEVRSKNLSFDKFNKAFLKLIDRHDMLRATVTEYGEQIVHQDVPKCVIQEYDIRNLSYDNQIEVMAGIRNEMSSQVMPSDQWPLFDIRAVQLTDSETHLYFSWDFINLDAWSMFMLCREWHTLYLDESVELPSLNVSFRDYMIASQKLKFTDLYDRDRLYWLNRIPSIPGGPALPVNTEVRDGKFSRRIFRLDREGWNTLKRKASTMGLTPSSILLAAYAEVISLWSENSHFSLNLTFFNRLPMHEDVEKIVGDFTSLVVLEADLRPALPFSDMASGLQSKFMKDFEHRSFSGVEVIREWAKYNKAELKAVMPIVFTSCLVLSSSQGEDAGVLGLFGDVTYGISQTPQVWLDNQVMEDGGSLLINWDAVDDVFQPGVLDLMFRDYCSLVEKLSLDNESWNSVHPIGDRK